MAKNSNQKSTGVHRFWHRRKAESGSSGEKIERGSSREAVEHSRSWSDQQMQEFERRRKEERERFEFLRNQEMIKLRDSREKRRELRMARLRWGWSNLFGSEMNQDKSLFFRQLAVRCISVLLCSVISIYLVYSSMFAEDITSAVAMVTFLFTLVPLGVMTAVFGLELAIITFSVNLVFFIFRSGGQAYLLSYVLVYILLVDRAVRKNYYRNAKTVLKAYPLQHLFMSFILYVLFVLVGQASFYQIDFLNIVVLFLMLIPQTLLSAYLIYGARKLFLGKMPQLFRYHDFREAYSGLDFRVKDGHIHGKISRKIYYILVSEAVVLGIASAVFANMLLPSLQEHIAMQSLMSGQLSEEELQQLYENPDGSAASYYAWVHAYALQDDNARQEESADQEESAMQGETDASEEEPGDSGAAPASFGRNPFTEVYNDYAQNVLQTGRQEVGERLHLGESGLAFDIKLILFLLNVIFPIVVIINFAFQRAMALPIMEMTHALDGFIRCDASKEQTISTHSIENLDIRTGDELEEMSIAIKEMANQVNDYIDMLEEEAKLREDLRVAKASSEAKSNFLSNVSHEIRTPINAVLGMDEMILRETSADRNIDSVSAGRIRSYAENIRDAGHILLSVINDILDLSKIESGKMEIKPAPYRLRALLGDVSTMIRVRAEQKGLVYTQTLDPDLPDALIGDELRIRQILINLLNNAVKYTDQGEVRLEVSRKGQSAQTLTLSFCVRDTGIGIKKENLPLIFGDFQRIDEEHNHRIEGTGLGLSIVKRLVGLMNGDISVSSEYEKGSVFTVYLPQEICDTVPGTDASAEEAAPDLPEERAFHTPDCTYLLVDDNRMNLLVAKHFLDELGGRIDTAASGNEALEKMRTATYDLIFMDHMMPDLDGIQTFERSLTDPGNINRDTPMIMMTANALSGMREEYLSKGFADYLSKPLDSKELLRVIRRHLPSEKMEPAN
jgi:signal transduction histidine kinase/ActR/RegA family two-component response regulator